MPTLGPSKSYDVDFKRKIAQKIFCAISVSIETNSLSEPILGNPDVSRCEPEKYRLELIA
jgi:hypothetical protein